MLGSPDNWLPLKMMSEKGMVRQLGSVSSSVLIIDGISGSDESSISFGSSLKHEVVDLTRKPKMQVD